MRVYVPVKPSGAWYVYGTAPTAAGARSTAEANAGCIPWSECERIGWRVIPADLKAVTATQDKEPG